MDVQLDQQQKAKQELKKYKIALDLIEDCIFIFDPESLKFTYVNAGALNQVGYEGGELLNMTPMDISLDIAEDSFRTQIAPLVSDVGQTSIFETSFWHQEGFIVPVEIKLQYIGLAEDDGCFVAVTRDISLVKKEEMEYQQLFEASRDAIIVTTNEQFLDCNRTALEMFKYDSKNEFLQLNIADVSPEMQASGVSSKVLVQQQINDAIENKVAFFPWTHRCKDGTEFPAEILLSPYERDGVMVVQAVVRDLGDRIKAEQDKEMLQAKLLHAQKLESVGHLAAGIAHEINTPTQFIGTNLDFMDEAAQDIAGFMSQIEGIAENAPEEISTAIKQALEEADWEYLSEELPQAIIQSRDGLKRVSTIVRAMKEFSHPGSKEKDLQDLNRIISTTVTVARNEWKYVAEMKFDLDPDLPEIPLLADEMGQVILNMLVNSAHSISEKQDNNEGENTGTISISTRKVGDVVELRINDTGAGIPENDRSRIFDPFYTTKKVGKGTGQGLAISHDVITEKHGGSIEFTSEIGKGTEFIITLPVE